MPTNVGYSAVTPMIIDAVSAPTIQAPSGRCQSLVSPNCSRLEQQRFCRDEERALLRSLLSTKAHAEGIRYPQTPYALLGFLAGIQVPDPSQTRFLTDPPGQRELVLMIRAKSYRFGQHLGILTAPGPRIRVDIRPNAFRNEFTLGGSRD